MMGDSKTGTHSTAQSGLDSPVSQPASQAQPSPAKAPSPETLPLWRVAPITRPVELFRAVAVSGLMALEPTRVQRQPCVDGTAAKAVVISPQEKAPELEPGNDHVFFMVRSEISRSRAKAMVRHRLGACSCLRPPGRRQHLHGLAVPRGRGRGGMAI